MRALPETGWRKTGMAAVVTRVKVRHLVQTLPLALLGRRPFIPARLPIAPEHHYRAQLAFLPAFGKRQWLLMGGTVHGLLRLAGEQSDLSRVLDVIGTGMLIPCRPLWLCDATLIAADRFRLPELAVVNPPSSCGRRRCSSPACTRRWAFPGGAPCRPGSPPAWSMSWEPPGSCGDGRRGGRSADEEAASHWKPEHQRVQHSPRG
jgi:hypothetical protein